jgi:hypothetical protein
MVMVNLQAFSRKPACAYIMDAEDKNTKKIKAFKRYFFNIGI